VDRAGVSRNAYYSLARKPSVLPASLKLFADALGVPPSELLEEDPPAVSKARRLRAEVDRIARMHHDVDRDNVQHTLLLLEETPVSRLRRALRRGRGIHIQS